MLRIPFIRPNTGDTLHSRTQTILKIAWVENPSPYITTVVSQKRTGIGHFDAIDDQTVRIRKFFEEIGL